MRFTLIKDLKKDKSMKPIMNGLLLFTLIYLVTDVYVTKLSIGLFSEQIKSTLFGNMDEFLDPITQASFLEYIHAQIFFMMMIALTLSAIYIRMASKSSYSLIIVNLLMLSALLTLITLGLSYYANDIFINLYVISFFTWHFVAFYMSIYALWSLNYAKSL